MSKLTFTFGNPQRNGNSLLKLLVYFHGSNAAETVYSFDGRFHKTGNPRFTDDTKYWNEENGRRYLQKQFADKFSHHPQLKYAAIVDSRYPLPNTKHRVWDMTTSQWVTPSAANAIAHQAHIAQRSANIPSIYSFRLSIPLLKKTPTESTKWKPFYSTCMDPGRAMLDLVGQFIAWRKATPSVRPQSIGQFFGKANGQFSTDQANVPRFGWFDVNSLKPKYHGSNRVITSYEAIQNSAKDISELISNYTA